MIDKTKYFTFVLASIPITLYRGFLCTSSYAIFIAGSIVEAQYYRKIS
jgi:hypothetical protein